MGLRDLARELMYRGHRERVLAARSQIDHRMLTNGAAMLKAAQMREDHEQYARQRGDSLKLLVSMNGILRTQGFLDTFAQRKLPGAQSNNLRVLELTAERIERENLVLGQRLLCTKPALSTRRPATAERGARRRQRPEFVVPVRILSKYENLRLPESKEALRRLLRPRVFFELAIQGVRPLGRIVVQLFTEACPQVVLEFVRLCAREQKERVQILRLFPSLWMEGEVRLGLEGKALTRPRKIEYDMRALDHGQGPGVLSFAGRHLRGFRNGFLNFSISFKPLDVLKGRRVAFGLVQGGQKMLDSLKAYGTKNGKPIKAIAVTGCGVL